MKEKKMEQSPIAKRKNNKLKFAALALTGVLAFSGMSGLVTSKSMGPNFNLPSKSQVVSNLDYLGINEYDRSFLSTKDKYDAQKYKEIKNNEENTYVTRLTPPANGEPISINVYMKNLTDFEKKSFINMTENINTIFEKLNNNYKFKLNFNPEFYSYFGAHSINFFDYKFILNENVAGTESSFKIKKNDVYQINRGTIQIDKDKHTDFEALITHEFMHYLGLGDAYLQQPYVSDKDYMIESVMNSAFPITLLDIKLLASLFCDLSNEKNNENYLSLVNFFNNQGIMTYVDKNDILAKKDILTNERISEELKKMGYSTQSDWKIENINENVHSIEPSNDDFLGDLYFNVKKYNNKECLVNHIMLSKNSIDYSGNLEYNTPMFECNSTNIDIMGNTEKAINTKSDIFFKFGDYVVKLILTREKGELSKYDVRLNVEKIISEELYNNIINKTDEMQTEYKNIKNSNEFFNKYLDKSFEELFGKIDEQTQVKPLSQKEDEKTQQQTLAEKIEEGYNKGKAVKIKFNLPQEEELTR